MKRRLNIACGVLHQPEVLLLDEPTAGVDPQSRERIWEMLGTLKSTGTSLLLTTHQLDEAERVCEHIVIIDHGKVIADGTLEELIEKTVGPSRTVTLTLDGPARPISNGFEVTDNQLRGAIEDVAGELPAALAAVASGGQRVLDVRVDAPTLHAVFLHLTGRELRE